MANSAAAPKSISLGFCGRQDRDSCRSVRRVRTKSGFRVFAPLFLGGALVFSITSRLDATTVVITSPQTIGPLETEITPTSGGAPVPMQDADIILRGTTLTMNGRFQIASLTVERNLSNQPGILTHSAAAMHDYSGDGSDVVYGVRLEVIGNATIQGSSGPLLGSRLDVTGKGWLGSQGPGLGGFIGGAVGGGGGSYGGAGADGGNSSQVTGSAGIGGFCYGFDPINLYSPQLLGSGGGGSSPMTGGPGGGAVALIVGGTLTISGEVLANGGPGPGSYMGGGSGGSILLQCATLSGSAVVSANGGDGVGGCCAGTGGGGGGGRIGVYYSSSAFLGSLRTFGGAGSRRGGAGTIYEKAGTEHGTLLIDNNDASNSETTEFYGPVTVDADVLIRNSGRVGPGHGQGDFGFTVDGDLTIDSDGAIYALGRGYFGSQGPGRGLSVEGYSGGGGAYGGAGGDAGGSSQAALAGGLGGDCYGDQQSNIFEPSELGSGGGNVWSSGTPNPNSGGFGGGKIWLSVNGTLDLAGQINANGQDAPQSYSGGGSGGSVQISCQHLIGPRSGTITAIGGAGSSGCCASTGGGGGGGRIALYFDTYEFLGQVSASGGPGNVRGGAGTIYRKTNNLGQGLLIVDNGGNLGETTEINDPMSIDADIVVRNSGRLGPKHRQLDFDLIVNGDVTIQNSGALFADGRGLPGSLGAGAGGASDGTTGGGAGYGGVGGSGNGAPGGAAYGTIPTPALLGSGGGNLYQSGLPTIGSGGSGGGAIKLTVNGTLQIESNGTISANGLSGSSYAGGGSGGSIWIECDSIIGGGTISAKGGAGGTGCCASPGGGGGGGRIAVYSHCSSIVVTQVGPGTGYQSGAAGSAYWSEPIAGDMNGDSQISLEDLEPFAEALIGPNPSICQLGTADINRDGASNGKDIFLFLDVLLGQ